MLAIKTFPEDAISVINEVEFFKAMFVSFQGLLFFNHEQSIFMCIKNDGSSMLISSLNVDSNGSIFATNT